MKYIAMFIQIIFLFSCNAREKEYSSLSGKMNDFHNNIINGEQQEKLKCNHEVTHSAEFVIKHESMPLDGKLLAIYASDNIYIDMYKKSIYVYKFKYCEHSCSSFNIELYDTLNKKAYWWTLENKGNFRISDYDKFEICLKSDGSYTFCNRNFIKRLGCLFN